MVESKMSDALVMTDREAEKFVMKLLSESGPQSTKEIERFARKEQKKCPDQTVLFLMKMKKKGLILGAVSMEKKGWLWSLP